MAEKQKRKTGVTIILWIIVAVIVGLFLYLIIGNFTSSYTSIAYSDAIDLIYQDENNETVIFYASFVQDGTETEVKFQALEAESSDTYTVKAYTLSVPTDDLNNFEAPSTATSHIGESFKSALLNEIEETKLAIEANKNAYKYGTDKYLSVNNCGLENTVYHESVILSWLPYIIMFVIIGIIGRFFLRMLSSASGSNSRAMDFNKSTARRADNTKVKFNDVAGCDEEKAELAEIVDYLKQPAKYKKAGAKFPKGFLLIGPPGTGKTLLAKAIAGEAGVPFFSISGSDFVEMFVGVGAGRVRDLFRTAEKNRPCIIFIDEIDAVGRQRGAGLGGGNDEREQTLNQLLVELDGFEENNGVIVIAATNREDVLDPALLRAGRFDRQITVDLPDANGREAIFRVHAKGKLFDDQVDFKQLAKRTVGFSGADIANILNDAAILTVRAKREKITMADLDEAIDRRIAGPAKSNKGLLEKERKQIAYHEAGHAIIGLTLPAADKVRKITIIPRGRTGGHVLMTPEDDRFLMTKTELEAEICGLLGGRTSEEIFFKDVSTGASNDIERATYIARMMVVEYGMSSLGPIQYEKASGSVFLGRDYTNTQKNFSINVADEIDKEIRKIIENAHAEANRIIQERKEDVILIAETLIKYETINEEEIEYLLANRKMPEESVTQREAANRKDSKVEEVKAEVVDDSKKANLEDIKEEVEKVEDTEPKEKEEKEKEKKDEKE